MIFPCVRALALRPHPLGIDMQRERARSRGQPHGSAASLSFLRHPSRLQEWLELLVSLIVQLFGLAVPYPIG